MEKIQNYTIIEKIDETLSSDVYRAQKDGIDKSVIIKVLKTSHPSKSEIARFKQEYELIRKIDFQGVIRTYDLLEYAGKLALILEDFNGIPLNKAFKNEPVTLDTFFDVAIPLSETLGNLHKMNIVHMDIKPRNILINPDDRQIKITDFGISTQMTRENEEIYNPDVIKGTLAYLSPEQSGRMNRQVDYRTDLYSLGITFYELLTGKPPFISDDPMEVIHAHLAKKPVPPDHLNPQIPSVVSDIVLKLMSKSAEDRYQNGFGLMADLQHCLDLYVKQDITPFRLGTKDLSLKFTIPQKLYGRANEITQLIDSFNWASRGKAGITLVSGYPGIGKTALINEIQTPIVERKGFFISGKCEQIRRDVPYSAVIQAFQGLIRQLLCEKREAIETWKEKLIKALSPNEAIITEMIPEVAHIIGPQPEITELGSEEFKNRFSLAFKNFITAFSQKEHPLVLFLDDFQWADLSSFQLFKSIAADPDTAYLLVIASYRNNEVTHGHPFMRLMDEMKEQGIAFQEIELTPLTASDLDLFIRDFLRCREDQSKPLADLVHKKTGGNPFFINQFMKTLHDRQLLQVDADLRWQWDYDEIRQLELTDNVVALLSDKMGQLSESTRDMLKVGACIGSTFDLERVSAILDKSMETIWTDVRDAVNDGYIEIHQDEIRFQHDRIREAAYLLIPEEKQKSMHYQIGKYALEKKNIDRTADDIFYVTDHLNHAKSLITDPMEKKALAKLNLLAGEHAIHSAAYASALIYLEHGISILEEDSWEIHYDLSLNLYKGAVAAACLTGQFDTMNRYTAAALLKCREALDQVAFYEYQVLALIARNEMQTAIQTGLTILNQLGIKFPKKPNTLHALMHLIRVRIALRGKTTKDLLNLPKMTDPKMLAAGQIISRISTPAFQSNPNLYVLLEFTYLLLSIQYGNTPGSSVAYGAYAIFLCAFLEDFDNGYEFGTLVMRLFDKLGDNRSKAHSMLIFHCFIRHWKDSVHKSLPHLLEGFQVGKETGDLEVGAYCLFAYCGYALIAGKELTAFNEEMTKHLEAVRQINQETPLIYMKLVKQVVLNLTGKTDDPCSFKGEAYNEEEMLPIHNKAKDISALAALYCHKLHFNYLFGNIPEALVNSKLMKKYYEGTRSTLNEPRYYLFASLVDLARYPEVKKIEKRRIFKSVAKAAKKLKKYAQYSPSNSQFAYYLVLAEQAAASGDYEAAVGYYDKAVSATRESGFVHYEALAIELTAKFYLSKNNTHLAGIYMCEARHKYMQWGALAKVKHLDATYPELVAVSKKRSHGSTMDSIRTAVSLSTIESTQPLDFSTVTKASEAIFSEIILSKLLQRLMGILIENAGAEKGFIILADQDKFLVEAEGNIASKNVDVLKSTPVDLHEGLSATIVNYAAKTKKALILHNASNEGEFIRDPYIVKNKPKSILCLPILNQGQLTAILYLENNLATNAFTQERLQVLNMLSSQIAISIDNARLYENLEQKVEERTFQLKIAQAENLQKAHRAGMADIAKETLHNVGNILNSVKTVTDTLSTAKKNSTLTGLSTANNLLKKQMNNLEQFIVHDPKGKKLLEYYIVLEELLDKEKTYTENQLKRLQEKVDEIVKVIHTLQSHIGSDDTYLENVRLKEEIQFVLETKRDSLAKDKIKVMETYNDIPHIKVQKSKLAHILDNLITNAKESLENTKEPEKIINIEVARQEEKVRLYIRDNGEGISLENIEKIFFHGFTTKPGKAGHNLHNCANNMTEMGGKIWAESQGIGKGATFVLEFPIIL